MYLDIKQFGVNDRYLAHTPDEKLSEHLECTKKYLEKIIDDKNLEEVIDGLIRSIDNENFEFIKSMFLNAIYLHDLGKMNPCFQAKKMNNPLFKEYQECSDSKHSFGGVVKFVEYYKKIIDQIEDDKTYYRLIYILYNFSYHINKHHGRLSSIEDYFSKTKNEKNEHPDFSNAKNNIEDYLDEKFEFYILNKLLFSLLVSSDYYATTEYMAKLPIKDFGLFADKKKKQLKTKFDTFIHGFSNPKGINKLRNEMFFEAEKNLLENLDKNIFYLEAPTGSGKTISSINLALQLLNRDKKLNKLFYIFPFNALVEQTKTVFDEIFENDLDIEIINSITPIKDAKQEDTESNYTQSYVNRLFFHSPAIITTHVSLFNILFGTSKEDNFPLWQLANSVIIIDEIQSYNNNLWWYIVEFFDKYAEFLNIKIIIMSATLPKLDYFLERKDNFVDLISRENRDYFFTNTLFRDRVDVDFTLLDDGKIELSQLEEFFDENKEDHQKILFEFIKKQSAREFYELIKDFHENVHELSGDDNKAYRQLVINKTKEDKPIIIVATQVIEAGVDIDMDLGFKDISTLDSEEQFMGRINRSCKKDASKVYFFDLDDASKIYRDDNRLGFDLKQEKYQNILRDKNYADYYHDVLQVIQKNGLRFENGLNTNIDNFNELLAKLNYQEISKTMTLINSQNFTLYFPFQIDVTIYKGVKEFEHIRIEKYLTDNKLDGQKVWDAYLQLIEIDSFVEKEFDRSYINSLMQFFTFNIIKFSDSKKPHYYSDEFGGFYFISDWESFIDKDGKFNRKKYEEKSESLFL